MTVGDRVRLPSGRRVVVEFMLRLRERVELRDRAHDWLPDLPPLVLQKYERVDVLDILSDRFLVATRHGIALLPHRTLKPERRP